ncbi:DUF58 domain-containing protein [Intrasporangium mesophilum]
MDATTTLSAERLLRRLEWRVVRRLDGRLQGDYRSLFRGSGLDFTDLREYEPGDDLRHIEWNVTARLDTPYVREYIEERELTAWLLLDHSASMGFGPVDRQKDIVLAEVATALAHVLTRGGSRVGAVILDRTVEKVVPPASGRSQVLRIAKTLLDRRALALHDASLRSGADPADRADRSAKRRAGGRRRSKEAGPGRVTDLSVMLTALGGMARRRSLVVVISDFISAPGWEVPLGRLARKHEVVALQITDPREFELPDAGLVYVEDAETGEQIFVDTSDPKFRTRLRAAAGQRQAELAALTRRAGVDLYTLSTDEDLVRSLVRVTELRRRRRR